VRFSNSALCLQGGENRRILLDLKCVLEEVQSGVKREESRRGELELQNIKDRCAWEVERSELKRRITQVRNLNSYPYFCDRNLSISKGGVLFV